MAGSDYVRIVTNGRVHVKMNDLEVVIDALADLSKKCQYHGESLGASGFQHGLPRCESCRQPWRVTRALEVLARYR